MAKWINKERQWNYLSEARCSLETELVEPNDRPNLAPDTLLVNKGIPAVDEGLPRSSSACRGFGIIILVLMRRIWLCSSKQPTKQMRNDVSRLAVQRCGSCV